VPSGRLSKAGIIASSDTWADKGQPGKFQEVSTSMPACHRCCMQAEARRVLELLRPSADVACQSAALAFLQWGVASRQLRPLLLQAGTYFEGCCWQGVGRSTAWHAMPCCAVTLPVQATSAMLAMHLRVPRFGISSARGRHN